MWIRIPIASAYVRGPAVNLVPLWSESRSASVGASGADLLAFSLAKLMYDTRDPKAPPSRSESLTLPPAYTQHRLNIYEYFRDIPKTSLKVVFRSLLLSVWVILEVSLSIRSTTLLPKPRPLRLPAPTGSLADSTAPIPGIGSFCGSFSNRRV